MEAEIAGNRYAICNVEGELHALDGECPHAGGPLGQGALHGATLVCPWHAWEYDCRTGANDFDPDLKLEKFPVKVEAGEILIDVSETGA
jgi:nitrite reductase/ring-hydroxylating ferredoxin subunit